MTTRVLRLFADTLAPGAVVSPRLGAENRAVYVESGMATFSAGAAMAAMSANSAWFSSDSLEFKAGKEGARLLRYELVASAQPDHGNAMGDGVESRLLLDAELRLDDPGGYLLRCDKVELPPGGIAYTHTHQGGGIRCLIEGGFNVKVHGKTTEIAEGEAWFEAGPDPVLAWAPDDRPGIFSRVMILPRRLKGQSSLRYMNPEDADKPKLQKYTVFIDEFIEL